MGRYDATGDTKSARGPARRRENVLARERSLTCVEVAMSAEGI